MKMAWIDKQIKIGSLLLNNSDDAMASERLPGS